MDTCDGAAAAAFGEIQLGARFSVNQLRVGMAPKRATHVYSKQVGEQKATQSARPFFIAHFSIYFIDCLGATTTNLIYQTPFVCLPLLSCRVLMRLNDCGAALGTNILFRSGSAFFHAGKINFYLVCSHKGGDILIR